MKHVSENGFAVWRKSLSVTVTVSALLGSHKFLHSQIGVILEFLMFSQKHLLGTDEDETVKMSGEKFIFTQKSFSEMKEALNIIEEKDSGHLGLMKMEFDGKELKIRIFYNNPVSNPKRSKLIYTFKNKPDQESKEVGYEHSDYSGSESHGSHSGWIVDCEFKTIQAFFSDNNTRIILEDV